MSGLALFLDWLDEAAGGFIRLAYLLAGITAVAVYFGAGHLPPAIENSLNAALPWSLAFAVETLVLGASAGACAGRMVYCGHDVRERHPLVTSDAL